MRPYRHKVKAVLSGTKRLPDIVILQALYLCEPWCTLQPLDRPNHLTCRLIACPVFLIALSVQFSSSFT